MATPELVIANAPFKTYPGNVIAVRCTDWLAGARGTLSTESDALASTGQAVREQQQVTGIIADVDAAYASADDTLEISGLPLVVDRYYEVWITARIEGYLDVTNGPALRASFNENWAYFAVGGLHGAGLATWTSDTNPLHFWHCTPELPYYRANHLAGFTAFRVLDPSEPLFFRFASDDGTDIEWLLDQIVFIPFVFNEAVIDGTDARTTEVAVEDGADSGDDNGKFTWFSRAPADAFSGTGDNQHKSDGDDAEYFARFTAPDFFSIFDESDGESPTHLYSLHTANYRGQRVWTDDTFDNRDTSGAIGTDPMDFGISPEGYGYECGSTAGGGGVNYAYVSGGVGLVEVNGFDGSVSLDMGTESGVDTPPANHGIRLQLYDQWDWSVIWEHSAGVFAGGAIVNFYPAATIAPLEYVTFDLFNGAWTLTTPIGGAGTPHDISAWFGMGALVGIRWEVKRYLLRIRVWDASGAEPSTWDEEFFRSLSTPGTEDYPYGDDEQKSTWVSRQHRELIMQFDISVDDLDFPYDITIHNWKVVHDPYGDPGDMHVRMERPEGTTDGEITVPFGSSYFVYWGKKDWTELYDDGDVYAAEFSVRVWNDSGAAEIQRAEAQIFYLFWIEGGRIVSMNWRSGDRRISHYRVLVGDKGS